MGFRELSKKMAETISLREIILSFSMVFLYSLIKTTTLFGVVSFTIIITLGILGISHLFLVYRVHKNLKKMNGTAIYLCVKKNALLVNHLFFLSKKEENIIKLSFPLGHLEEKTELTLQMITNKDSFDYDGKAYHLIQLK